MISYYHNPKTEDLIVWDPEEKELFIIEKIKNIKVFTRGEVAMGDDGERDERKPKRKTAIETIKKTALSLNRTKSGRTRITPEVIEKMKRLRSEMKSGREIAEEVGISIAAVWKYLKK